MGIGENSAPAFPADSIDPEAHGLHSPEQPNPGVPFSRGGNDHGVESIYYCANVEALWSHRAGFAATSCQRAKSGRNSR